MKITTQTALALLGLISTGLALPAHNDNSGHGFIEQSTVTNNQSPYTTAVWHTTASPSTAQANNQSAYVTTSVWTSAGLPCSTLVTLSNLPHPTTALSHTATYTRTTAIDTPMYTRVTLSTLQSTSTFLVDGTPCSTVVTLTLTPSTTVTLAAAGEVLTLAPALLGLEFGTDPTIGVTDTFTIYTVDSVPTPTPSKAADDGITILTLAGLSTSSVTLGEVTTVTIPSTSGVTDTFTIYTEDPVPTPTPSTAADDGITILTLAGLSTSSVTLGEVTTVTIPTQSTTAADDEVVTIPALGGLSTTSVSTAEVTTSTLPTQTSSTPKVLTIPQQASTTLVSMIQFTTYTEPTSSTSFAVGGTVPPLSPPVPSAYTTGAPTTTATTSKACASAASTPYIEGSLVAGQPEWNVCIPGSIAPWSEVAVTGSTADNWSIRDISWTVDGEASTYGSAHMTESSFEMDFNAFVESTSMLALNIDAQAMNGGPFDIAVTVTIETLQAKRVKRDTLTFELSDTISVDASSSESSSFVTSAVSSSFVSGTSTSTGSSTSSSTSASASASTSDSTSSSSTDSSVPASNVFSSTTTSIPSLAEPSLGSSTTSEGSVVSSASTSSSVILESSIGSSSSSPATPSSIVPSSHSSVGEQSALSSITSASVTSQTKSAAASSVTPTTTVGDISTTVLTLTSCGNLTCVPETLTTGVTVITTTESGVETEYTTYCPLTSSSVPSEASTTSSSTTTNAPAVTVSQTYPPNTISSKATTFVTESIHTGVDSFGDSYTSTAMVTIVSTQTASVLDVSTASSSSSSAVFTVQEGSATSFTPGWTLTFVSIVCSLFML